MPVVNDETALLSGSYWNGIEVTGSPVIVTFSFPTAAPAYDATITGFTPATLGSFQAFTAAEQAQALQALGEWSAASGLIFIQVAPGEGDINFQNVDLDTTSFAGAGGIGFFPFGNWDFFSFPSFTDDLDAAGDIFMNSQFIDGTGSVNYGTLLHEIGHAIGLKHPTEVVIDFAPDPDVVHDQVLSSDDPTRTIMATVGGASSLLQLDKDAAAFIYGPAGTGGVVTASASGANAVSTWSWDGGTATLTQTAATIGATIRGSSVNDVINGSIGDDRLFGLAGDDELRGGQGNDSLFGGSGTDTLIGGVGDDSYFILSATAIITEGSGEGTDHVYATVSFTLADNIEVLSLFGDGLTGTGNDQGVSLFGDGTFATTLIGGAGQDFIVGGAGGDTIAGHGGPDAMFGQGGADRFIFTALGDAPLGANLTRIGDFVAGEDKIDLSALTTVGGVNPGQPLAFIGTGPFTNHAGEVRQAPSGLDTIVEGDVDGDGAADFQIRLDGPVTLQASDFLMVAPPCFRQGTRILTDRGERAVETLAIGDQVITVTGEARPIEWIGYRHVDCGRHPDPRRVWPVHVSPGAFADAQPHDGLWLSPDHAVFVDDVLIPIKQLVNGTTITQVRVDEVTYYHLELARHDVLLAEGLAVETYLDTGNRATFANTDGAIDLHPLFDGGKTGTQDAYAPLAGDEARVRPVWDRLVERSAALGRPVARITFTDDPAVCVRRSDRTVRPVVSEPNRLIFVLPPGDGPIELVSRWGYPTDRRPWADDWRRLGVYVSRIVWHDHEGPHDLPVDHPTLGTGWWGVERAGPLLRRWTDGHALLPALPGVRMIEIHLAGTLSYRLDAPEPGERTLAA